MSKLARPTGEVAHFNASSHGHRQPIGEPPLQSGLVHPVGRGRLAWLHRTMTSEDLKAVVSGLPTTLADDDSTTSIRSQPIPASASELDPQMQKGWKAAGLVSSEVFDGSEAGCFQTSGGPTNGSSSG